ncbi:5-oxoprolinase [Capsaspora owczarzaki ATCC 30864]|uniref:5-oxoprolinase n=1 Tax=Capsaspora owczarzaki (strain ATCC 30864) TaxID=595528 RepID=A0A0D2VTX0_CAPO3|nr:5-oxoprolinase [Capsaspora owczarzaki ATCC 30864]KJE94777.1 5-oxoprolinase [Capsaspora owczarzaki ATCC 30864]|eukprot:XP_004347045.1 5-oxoprolinase [Capsaspora owczarzaki ATCC 30864]
MFRFAIDRGGSFTDVYAELPDNRVRVLKLLSVDPAYPDAPTEGIRRILTQETGVDHPAGKPIDTSRIEWIRMGTTVATNALLERNGERCALLITRGFRDLLHIGTQSRPRIFDLQIAMPERLYERVIEVDERVRVLTAEQVAQESAEHAGSSASIQIGITGESVMVEQPIDMAALERDLKQAFDAGIRSVAVVLMHSYTFPDHERQVGAVASRLGFSNVSLSSAIMPMVKIVPRGFTAVADAYLTPAIQRYVDRFSRGFDERMAQGKVPVLFMQSDGGLTRVDAFSGSRAILSGPAGGVVGYGKTTFDYDATTPAIGFDMGGTSTDVSRYAGTYEHVFESTTAGVTIQAPQLDINTVAAGGGSRLFFRAGMFVVGPESVGAHPGPTCYRKGGPLAITDANLFLGRLMPEFFPHIFGPSENEPLDVDATRASFLALTDQVNAFLKQQYEERIGQDEQASRTAPPFAPMTAEAVALGFIRVANEAMCRPIRAITQSKGYDTTTHTLSCFGGAGGQHACAIARSLGMRKIFIHKYSGILSAYGMALADVVCEKQEPCATIYSPASLPDLQARLARLGEACKAELRQQGFADDRISLEYFANMRYDRTDCAIMAPASSLDAPDFERAFLDCYRTEFGFVLRERTIVVDDVRVRASGHTIPAARSPLEPASTPGSEPPRSKFTACYFEDGLREDTGVFSTEHMRPGHVVHGPAILVDKNSTILVEPQCRAELTPQGDVVVHVQSATQYQGGSQSATDGGAATVDVPLDAIQLSIFGHRFMSIAEQMGRALQRTSISTNIKERLDFSCALFGPDGGLVANAPHIPVHLGAMQEAVRFQVEHLGPNLHPGDVLVSNHPAAGGSHLPDITVITPVFRPGITKPVFFVASRGHHADIGGITPGSMPPTSKTLLEEGASIISFKLVEKGEFQEAGITEILNSPAKLPGCSGTRNLSDNLSDLRAQVAANQRGIVLVNELIDYYGLHVVQAYMGYIRENAEVAVREMLREVARKARLYRGSTSLVASDSMDDGTAICLKIDIDETTGSATFDFAATGPEVYGNCNAPRAVTYSAVIYCLRCLVGHDVPLNQGCLNPVNIVIPDGSILAPSRTAAVVGGNVLTSQRVVDVVLKAFGACAASQGCMNNLTFGDETVGYYETIAGGAGAGPTWHGRGGVHTHMTNTRITDPEILERRYPVILRQFSLREASGGRGQFSGGDGVIRLIEFTRPLTVSILSERRTMRPYGLFGGEAGASGMNLLIVPREKDASRAAPTPAVGSIAAQHLQDSRLINLGARCTVLANRKDKLAILSPGGGGYGRAPATDHPDTRTSANELTTSPSEEELAYQSIVRRHAAVSTLLDRSSGSVAEYLRAQESA